jgi:tripartite-type tricarboxylate transporter receptor subunit TctC
MVHILTKVFIAPYASDINLVKDGKAIAIAITSPKRIPEMPDLTTVAEAGVPGYEWVFWYGILAPAKTPRAVVEKLQVEIATILRQPDVRQRFAPLGITPAINSPKEFDKLITSEIANFNRLAKAANIKPE